VALDPADFDDVDVTRRPSVEERVQEARKARARRQRMVTAAVFVVVAVLVVVPLLFAYVGVLVGLFIRGLGAIT
jgi:uncharacterized membrane protein